MIKKNPEFKHIIDNGTKINTAYFSIFHLPKKEKFYRVGISVPKKLGNAVLRNKIKRQIRHIINDPRKRFNLDQDYIIIINSNFLKLDFKTKRKLLEKYLTRGETHEKN